MHISCVSKASTGGGQRSAAWGSVCRPVEQTQLGRSPQQIVEDFDGVLTLAQVYDALSYYHEHEKRRKSNNTSLRIARRYGKDRR